MGYTTGTWKLLPLSLERTTSSPFEAIYDAYQAILFIAAGHLLASICTMQLILATVVLQRTSSGLYDLWAVRWSLVDPHNLLLEGAEPPSRMACMLSKVLIGSAYFATYCDWLVDEFFSLIRSQARRSNPPSAVFPPGSCCPLNSHSFPCFLPA